MRVLVVEDDTTLGPSIARELVAEGHQVELETGGKRGLELAISGNFDLVVLDLCLPEFDGIEILRAIRQADRALPVIVVTARGDVEERVLGLDCGADDYLVKPFSFVELLARIRAMFRRSEAQFEKEVRIGDLVLDRLLRTATCGASSVELSSREFQLLEFFVGHADQALSRTLISQGVWGFEFDTGTNVVDVYVNYVRKKLRGLGLEPIGTVRGIGYRLDEQACFLQPA